MEYLFLQYSLGAELESNLKKSETQNIEYELLLK